MKMCSFWVIISNLLNIPPLFQVHDKIFEFSCEFCPFKTATEQGIIDHVEAVHKTDGKFVAGEENGPPKGGYSYDVQFPLSANSCQFV